MVSVWIILIWSREDSVPVPVWFKKTVTLLASIACVAGKNPCKRNKIEDMRETPAPNMNLDSEKTDHDSWVTVEEAMTWKEVAFLLDGLFFRIYMLAVFSVTLVCFLMLGLN